MAAPPLSDELAQQAAQAYLDNGKNQTRAAEALGLSRATYKDRLKVAARRGMLGTEAVLPGFEITKTTTVTDNNGDTVREFVQQVPANDNGQFSVPAGFSISRLSTYTDQDGRIIGQWTQSKPGTSTDHVVEALKAVFEAYKGDARLAPAPKHTDEDLLSVYPIADQHNGLLAWGKESGEDYDLKIGADRLRSCMSRLVSQSPASKHALILNLGDWQHNDDGRNMTPRSGNILDVDSRYFKILTTGVQLMVDCIDLALKKHQFVIVRNLPGNHDPHASIALTVALAAFYANNPRVTVDQDPSDFFFHRFGKTLLGATHGHKLKPDRMAMTMACQMKEDWGATDYHYFYFGHVHHEQAKEVAGVRVESFQTLAAKDAYHAGAGYQSGQSLTSITIHITDGEIGRHRINLPSPKKPAAIDIFAVAA